MKIQRTFEGSEADNKAIEWLLDLAKIFHIKSARIKEVKQPYDWKGKRVRLDAIYK